MGSAFSEGSKKVTVKVTCSHNGTILDISQHHGVAVTVDWTTTQLQEAIQELSHVHHRCQRLMYAGKQMGAEDTIRSIAGPELEQIPDRINLFLLVEQNIFPEKLGPCSPARVPLEGSDFSMPELQEVFTRSGFYWEMKTGILEAHGLRARTASITGQVSPVHPVTAVDDVQRSALMIPAEATQFVWSYPVSDWQRVESDAYAIDSWDLGMGGLAGSSALKSFLSLGGFIYFDAAGSVSAVTTLGHAEGHTGGVHFGKPKRWPPEWTSALVENGRFQKVTTRSLRELGAQHFCWLRPSESIECADGNPLALQPEVPHGGFVYLFHEKLITTDSAELSLDRYFPVGAMLPTEKNASSVFRPYSLADGPDYGQVEAFGSTALSEQSGTEEISERRVDPLLDSLAVTYVEMREALSCECWTEEEMQEHWLTLRPQADEKESPLAFRPVSFAFEDLQGDAVRVPDRRQGTALWPTKQAVQDTQ